MHTCAAVATVATARGNSMLRTHLRNRGAHTWAAEHPYPIASRAAAQYRLAFLSRARAPLVHPYRYFFTAIMVVCGTGLQAFVLYKRLDGYRDEVGDAAFDNYIKNDVPKNDDGSAGEADYGADEACPFGSCLNYKVYKDFFGLNSLSIEASLAAINLPNIFGAWLEFPPAALDAPDLGFEYAYRLTYSLGLSLFVVEYILKAVENVLNGESDLIDKEELQKRLKARADKAAAKKAPQPVPGTPGLQVV